MPNINVIGQWVPCMEETIKFSVEPPIATLTIHNPGKRNAVNPPMAGEAIEAIESIEDRSDIRVLVVTGSGEKAFSAGFDITYYSDERPESADDEDAPSFSDFSNKVKHFDYPTIGKINGGTYGGAMHLAASCDLRIAVSEAEFGITPARIGRVYSGEAIYEIMAEIGPANVKEFLFTANFIDAERAYDMGFVNDVVPREELDDRTMELANTIAGNAPISLIRMKEIVRTIMDHGALTEAESKWIARLREEAEESDDHQEGVEAFMENREPEFTGT